MTVPVPSQRRLIVGISGASGVIYGLRLLQLLRNAGVETHLVMSKTAELTFAFLSATRQLFPLLGPDATFRAHEQPGRADASAVARSTDHGRVPFGGQRDAGAEAAIADLFAAPWHELGLLSPGRARPRKHPYGAGFAIGGGSTDKRSISVG